MEKVYILWVMEKTEDGGYVSAIYEIYSSYAKAKQQMEYLASLYAGEYAIISYVRNGIMLKEGNRPDLRYEIQQANVL